MTVTPLTPTVTRTAHQRRLQAATKRLVIELGYLEHCLTEGLQDPHLRTAATSLDTAIACLQQHLSER